MGKKLVKQQYLLHVYPQYGERWTTNGVIGWWVWGTPSKFQRVSRLGSVTARQVGVEQRRHLYSAGRPSGWALAHISSCF